MLGIAGGLITLQKLRVAPHASFSISDWTVFIIFNVVIGGIGSIEGPILGAIVFFVLREYLRISAPGTSSSWACSRSHHPDRAEGACGAPGGDSWMSDVLPAGHMPGSYPETAVLPSRALGAQAATPDQATPAPGE